MAPFSGEECVVVALSHTPEVSKLWSNEGSSCKVGGYPLKSRLLLGYYYLAILWKEHWLSRL